MTAVASLVATWVLFLFVYIPILSFHLRVYYANRQHLVYALRYSNITIVQCILFIIKLLYTLFSLTFLVYLYDIHSTQYQIILMGNAYLTMYILYGFVWKFWLLRYDIVTNNVVINSIWKSVINSKKFKSTNSSFCSKYRKTFGNSTIVFYVLFAVATIFTTIYCITAVFAPDIYHIYGNSKNNAYLSQLLASWDYIIPYILLLFMYLTTPSFIDNFYIIQELKYIFICLSINYAIYYGYIVILFMMHENVTKEVQDIIQIIEYNLLIFAQFCAMIISTKWVNNRCQRIIENDRFTVRRVPYGLELDQQHWIDIVSSPRTSTITTTASASHNLQFVKILSSSKLYHSFMNHLSKEMCSECLLSVTEFLQFRKHMKAMMLITKDDDFDIDELYSDGMSESTVELDAFTSQLYHIQFPSNIPTSWIVCNAEWDNKRKAYELYKKYIEEGSEFEINISSDKRKYFMRLFADYDAFRHSEDITEDVLMRLYDACCIDMVFLMRSAMQRFKPMHKTTATDV